MRTRDNVQRTEELAQVVAWLRRRAQLLDECGVGVAGLAHPDDITLPLVLKLGAEADALREAARRLEAGEHRT
jgi:hypothetical protein